MDGVGPNDSDPESEEDPQDNEDTSEQTLRAQLTAFREGFIVNPGTPGDLKEVRAREIDQEKWN